MNAVVWKRMLFRWSLILGLAALSVAARADDWTFMVYMDGDCDLEAAALNDFMEISSVGSTTDVNILVLFDRIPGESSGYDDWTNTRRGIVNAGDEPDTTWGTSIGELNMGNPQTVVDFATWGVQNYPATRYAFVFWNHGNGWREATQEAAEEPYKSVCTDVSAGDTLYVNEVHDSLHDVEAGVGEMDLVGFDACLMSMMEVAYVIREHTGIMAASVLMEPNDGWPYDTILGDLVATPTMAAVSLGNVISTRYYGSYGNDQAMSCLSLSDANVVLLAQGIDDLALAIQEHWNSSPSECVEPAYEVLLAQDLVVASENHGVAWPDSHGLAIYFPPDAAHFSSSYTTANVALALDTAWEEFLDDYYSNMAGSWVQTARTNTQEYDASSAAGLQNLHIDLYDFCLNIIENADGGTWVDFAYAGTEMGTFEQPFNTLIEGVANAPSGGIVHVKAGSAPETLTITKNVRIMAHGGNVIVGH